MKSIPDIVDLLDKHLKGQLSKKEKTELNRWANEYPDNHQLLQDLSNKEILKEKLNYFTDINSDRVWKLTKQKIRLRNALI